ncbi:MAG: hypothetical protein ABIG64_07895 [Candidatus Omnitrophota bacterium]
MKEIRRINSIFMSLGAFLFVSIFFVDWFFYPQFVWQLLSVRIIICLYLLAASFAVLKIKEEHITLLAMSCLAFSSLAMSMLCFVPGDGFGSPYFSGILFVVIISGATVTGKKRYYILLLVIMSLEHIILLSFLPFEIKDLVLNIIILVLAAVTSFMIFTLRQELKILQGFLPICAKCKQIRDDKGYWHQVEAYVHDHSEADFTHSICPKCAKELYGDNFVESFEEKKN